ncbi:hypothetical protein HUS70_17015 [Pandoraea nosoerga]|uniref:hypothetical protein n=1 Tax=Pandoraea nosoerga TaxID=2508296 RepID=UPI0019816D85|nr:hypothetical protein [Pandoraea nosoerga]MBN4667195.1 hypothetical protein [Pandoraea nosoerga]MBN4677182.1 hypothetical protein [Pandoraea nosoerga]MBN4681997.1 hypothetical protein [Pandoraea nosoerga]MBN4746315.1 hypothetical protein [Pandoraea nosoerga]
MLLPGMFLLCIPVALTVTWWRVYSLHRLSGHGRLRAFAWGAACGLYAGFVGFFAFVLAIPGVEVGVGASIALLLTIASAIALVRYCLRRVTGRQGTVKVEQPDWAAGFVSNLNPSKPLTPLDGVWPKAPPAGHYRGTSEELSGTNIRAYPPSSRDAPEWGMYAPIDEPTKVSKPKGTKRSKTTSRRSRDDSSASDDDRLSKFEASLDDAMFPVNDAVSFHYIDSSGSASERSVEVKLASDEYFQGYCNTRNATRTFKFSGVKGKVIRRDTGEILTVRQWRSNLLSGS